MIQALIPLSALFFGLALLLVGLGLQGTLLPIRATLENFTALEIGLMGTAYFAGFVAGCLRTSYLVRAVGHVRVFTAMVCIVSATPLLHALYVAPATWIVLRIGTGFCMAGVYMVIESWVNERAPSNRRGGILAVYTSINLAAITFGQFLLPLYDPSQLELFLLASVLVSLAAVPVALSRATTPVPLTKVSFRFMGIITQSPAAVAGSAAAGLVSGAFWTLGPAFALSSGLSVAQVSLFMAVVVVGGALGQWPVAYFSDRYDRRKVLLVTLVIAAIMAFAIYGTAIYYPPLLYLPAFLFGAASFPIYAVAVSHANDMITDDDFVETSSGMLLAHGVASAIGPLLAAFLVFGLGPPGLFFFMAVALVIGAAYVASRVLKSGVAAEEHHSAHVAMTASMAAVSLDPRSDEEPHATDISQ